MMYSYEETLSYYFRMEFQVLAYVNKNHLFV